MRGCRVTEESPAAGQSDIEPVVPRTELTALNRAVLSTCLDCTLKNDSLDI